MALAAEDQAAARGRRAFMLATRHKQELDFTLRYWATPAERALPRDRLGSLMRIARRHPRHRRDGSRPSLDCGGGRPRSRRPWMSSGSIAASVTPPAARRSSARLLPRLPRQPRSAEARRTLQPTGSFKVRGAESAVAAIAAEGAARGFVTASSGNHGIAVARAAARHGLPVTILVGGSVSPARLAACALGTDRCTVEIFGRDTDNRARALDSVRVGAAVYISPPKTHTWWPAGDGRVEILEIGQTWIRSWSDRGWAWLISGIGLWVKTTSAGPQNRWHPAGSLATDPAYLGTGSSRARRHRSNPWPMEVAGNIERGSITLRLAKRLVDEVVVVDGRHRAAAIGWAMPRSGPRHPVEGERGVGHRRRPGGEGLGSLADRRLAVVVTAATWTGLSFRVRS